MPEWSETDFPKGETVPNTPDIQQWHFRPRSPFILAWIAIPFALGAWLVWFAVSQAGSLGWLFFLLSALCSSIGALGFESWRRSWRNTRHGQEFIRLDEDDLSYCIEGVGAGRLPYTWLRSVYPVHTRGCQGVVIARRGHGVSSTFTIRKVSFGVGVERTFPVHSPVIEKIEVVSRGDVRRAKLYYMRNRHGKAARIREKREF